MCFRNTGQGSGDGYSRRREEITRGKQRVESDSDFEIDEDMEDVESPRDMRAEEADDLVTAEEINILRILLDMKIGGTRYPDRQTMERLGIADDVDNLLNNLGIGAFMFKRNESYKKATCLFLATLQIHLCASGEHMRDGSDGCITFWVSGLRRMLTFREVERAHYLPPGNRHGLVVDGDEIKALWRTIASGGYLSSDAKSSQIRSPPIRYVHKCLANVLYPRPSTGNVTTNELSMIDVALTGFQPMLSNGMQLKGSTMNGGVTRALIDQLRSYQSWSLLNESNRHACVLRMGGLVTPLLFAVGFVPDVTEKVAPPEEIDINYLKNSKILQRTNAGDDLIYQFTHLQFGNARMLLPNPTWTSLRGGANVDFNPPQSLLLAHSTVRRHSNPLTTVDRDERSQGAFDESMCDFEHFHFTNYTSTSSRQSAGVKAAHEHINLLQRWNKGQDKFANKLMRKIKRMASQIKTLQDRLSCTSTSGGVQRSTAPATAQPEESSEDEPEQTLYDTAGVAQPPLRQPSSEQPRHSSFEPRQRKRRSRDQSSEGHTVRPSNARADANLLRRCSSAARPTGTPDQTTPQPTPPADHLTPQTTARAGSSSIPPYTHESMNAEIDALLHGRR